MSFDTIVTLALFAGAFLLMMRYGGCGAHAFGHAHSNGGSGSGSGHAALGGGQSASTDRNVDPVCGMTVEKASAKTAIHEGQIYYFCSQNCLEKFEAAPASYAKAAAPASHGAGHRHGCC
jgi:YHS domain-containing protein